MKAKRTFFVDGPRYRVGDVWTVKGNRWLVKDELVTILHVEKPGKDCKVEVVNLANTSGWISVKELKKKQK